MIPLLRAPYRGFIIGSKLNFFAERLSFKIYGDLFDVLSGVFLF